MKRFHNTALQKLILPLIHHAQPASRSTDLICNAWLLAGDFLKAPFINGANPTTGPCRRHRDSLLSAATAALNASNVPQTQGLHTVILLSERVILLTGAGWQETVALE